MTLKAGLPGVKSCFDRCFDQETLVLSVVFAGLFCLYTATMQPGIVGLFYDDGIYLLASKALAMGEGYRFYLEPQGSAIIKYPPLFPAVMAPLWWLNGQFPQNVPLFKTFNIGFSLGALGLLSHIARRFLGFSVLNTGFLILFVGMNFFWIHYSHALLSEPLYLVLSLSALGLATALHQRKEALPSQKALALLAILCALTVYTRTMGLLLVAACTVWLAFRFNKTAALKYLTGSLLLVAPWFWWTGVQPGTFYTLSGYDVVPYNQTYFVEAAFAAQQAGGWGPLVLGGVGAFFQNLGLTVAPYLDQLSRGQQGNPVSNDYRVASILVLLLLGIQLWQAVGNLRSPVPKAGDRKSRFSPIGIYLALYLMFVPFWHAHDQYPRLLLCVLPLISLYGIQSVSWLLNRNSLQRFQRTASAILMVLFLGLHSFALSWLDFSGRRMAANAGNILWSEYEDAFRHIRQLTRPGETIWARYSGLYPLYTERPVIAHNIFENPESRLHEGVVRDDRAFIREVVWTVFEKENVRYYVAEPYMNLGLLIDPLDKGSARLLTHAADRLELLYTSPRGAIRLFRVLPAQTPEMNQ